MYRDSRSTFPFLDIIIIVIITLFFSRNSAIQTLFFPLCSYKHKLLSTSVEAYLMCKQFEKERESHLIIRKNMFHIAPLSYPILRHIILISVLRQYRQGNPGGVLRSNYFLNFWWSEV